MKHLKLVSKGFETYTGNFGPVAFKDGLSVDPVPDMFARRVAAATQVVFVDEDGTEEDASVAHALVRDAELRAPVIAALERQSDADKRAENKERVVKAIEADQVEILSRTQLEDVVQKSGVKALRVIGDKWGVKHKQAAALIDMILVEQSKWIEARNARIQAAGIIEGATDEASGGDTGVESAGSASGAGDGGSDPVDAQPQQAEGAVATQDAGAAGSAAGANEGESLGEQKA